MNSNQHTAEEVPVPLGPHRTISQNNTHTSRVACSAFCLILSWAKVTYNRHCGKALNWSIYSCAIWGPKVHYECTRSWLRWFSSCLIHFLLYISSYILTALCRTELEFNCWIPERSLNPRRPARRRFFDTTLTYTWSFWCISIQFYYFILILNGKKSSFCETELQINLKEKTRLF